MNEIKKKKITLWAIGLFFVFTNSLHSQNTVDSAIAGIGELLIPQGLKIRHQKTLYYEVVVSHNNFPSPAFWYKITFAKDCSFQFSIFPLYEEDTYDFYCYEAPNNIDFCSSMKRGKLVSLNDQRVYKDYNDEEVKSKSDSRFMDFKETTVKAGDAVYIAMFSTSGKDCGHILEFKLGRAFFVIKAINNKCPTENLYASDLTITNKKYKTVDTEKEAFEILDKTFCQIKPSDLLVTSIRMDGAKATFKPGIDFIDYAKNNSAEAKKDTISPKQIASLIDSVPTLKTSIKSTSDTALLAAKEAVISNVPLKTKPEILQNPVVVKSTADFVEMSATEGVNNYDGNYNAATKNKVDIDNVLFSTLLVELKERIAANNKQLKEQNAKLKKTQSKEERESISTSIKQLKVQTIELQEEVKEIRIKLKVIQKYIADNKKANHPQTK